jgi:dTDP-4-amino-4,6-dideoxygalactose transaminase
VVGGRPAGSQGTLAICSFYATKLVTSGEGGAVAGPAALVRRVRDARDYDEREDLVPRFNYKLTDLQAALGRSQLARLDAFVARRRAIAARYRSRLAGARCRLPDEAGERHVYHRFVITVDRPLAPLIAALQVRGIATRRPVYRPLHRALGLDGYPEAERLWATALSLPCYPSLADAEVDVVAAALVDALTR